MPPSESSTNTAAFMMCPATVTDSAACGAILSRPFENSGPVDAADMMTSLDARGASRPPSSITSVLDPVESERNQTLVAMLAFLRDSCKIVVAQKNRLLMQKDEDITSCKTMLARTSNKLAALEAHLAAAQKTIATVTTERDQAVSHASAIAEELKRTCTDYDDRFASLTIRVADAEANAGALQVEVQRQNTELSDVLLKNDDLTTTLSRVRNLYNSQLEAFRTREMNDARMMAQQDVEIAKLTNRLEVASHQRTAPASPRYSFQSFTFHRSSESETDSSFESDKPSPPRWRPFIIHRAPKCSTP